MIGQWTGVQFRGQVGAHATKQWFTFRWPAHWHVVWHMMPVTPVVGAPEVEWDVEVERADASRVTYWLTVRNLSGTAINFDGRYAVLN
ncbi:MAG: hypothetical protein L0H26_01240 [Microlunatus sp.]|nr:hypothetical protein [Microlunatus sp.]